MFSVETCRKKNNTHCGDLLVEIQLLLYRCFCNCFGKRISYIIELQGGLSLFAVFLFCLLPQHLISLPYFCFDLWLLFFFRKNIILLAIETAFTLINMSNKKLRILRYRANCMKCVSSLPPPLENRKKKHLFNAISPKN